MHPNHDSDGTMRIHVAMNSKEDMLERILEPEVMDSQEEAIDYDSMDHSVVNQLFVADLLKVWQGQSPILDIGTGTAQIPIEFCHQSETGEIIAIDLAEEMLKLARRNVQKAGFEKRITLQLVNARLLPYQQGFFPVVISNSIVHHIPEPALVFREMVRVAQPGATIFIRDLVRPPNRVELETLVARYAGTANEHQQRMFRESLQAALTVAEVRAQVQALGLNPAAVQQTSDRHWTWYCLNQQ